MLWVRSLPRRQRWFTSFKAKKRPENEPKLKRRFPNFVSLREGRMLARGRTLSKLLAFNPQSISFIHTTPQSIMQFIDIAANLTDGMFKGKYNGTQRHEPDLSSVLERARSAGVSRIMVTAGMLSQSEEALQLCQQDPSLYSTVGVHPTRAKELLIDPEFHCKQLLSIIEKGKGKVVAIGECGLDYDRTHFCSKQDQLPGFLAQFSLAEKTKLPMFLHDRNTNGDFLRIITENRSRFTTGVVHSFTGTLQEMQAYIQLDLYIGINGCSLKTDANMDVAKQIPLDRIMLETDCPYCEIRSTHVGFASVKSKWQAKDKKKHSKDMLVKGRCEPCQIRQVCEALAAAKGIPEEQLARAAFNNTMRVFFPQEAQHMGSSPYDWSIAAIPST